MVARRVAMASLLAVALGVASPARANPAADVVTLMPEAVPFALLQVDNPWGDVSVEGYDGEAILVESRKHAAPSGATGQVEIKTGQGGVVSIRTAMPAAGALEPGDGLARRPRIDLFVRVPRAVAVRAQIQSGLLRAHDLQRGAALYANAGAISVERIAGALLIDSTFAVPTVRQVVGDVEIDVLRADLALDDIAGHRLDAGVHEGTISATKVRSRRVALRVFRGDVALDAHGIAKGEIMVSVKHGDIMVHLAPRGDVALRARGGAVNLPGGGTLHKDAWHFGAGGEATAVTLVAGSRGRITFALP